MAAAQCNLNFSTVHDWRTSAASVLTAPPMSIGTLHRFHPTFAQPFSASHVGIMVFETI